MTEARCLFWHRKDLRLTDNLGLSKAASITKSITGVFILNENLFKKSSKSKILADSQIWFLYNSLNELQRNWLNIGSQLIILKGDPILLIPILADIIKAEFIYWNKDIEPRSILEEEKILYQLTKNKKKVSSYWDQLLINPEELKTGAGQPYKVYTAFWGNWQKKVSSRKELGCVLEGGLSPAYKPKSLIGISKAEQEKIKTIFGTKFISTTNLAVENLIKFKGETICPCQAGEEAGRKQLIEFITTNNILKYTYYRDNPISRKTSLISAGLRFGTISPRQAWSKSLEGLQLAVNYSEIQSIVTWQKELAWREFYQNVLFNFPEVSQGPYRKKWKTFPWINNPAWLKAWKNGLTGIPIVDAAMRELKETGWMHNRCRMIVASFLVKDLICNWQYGEKFFMELLVDGDLASNNGGWQWSASSGVDPKPLRIFNPYLQAKKFDPEGKYIKKWIPELSHINKNDLISGSISPIERRCYPEAIVNHKRQQYIFKSIYKKLI